MAYDLYIYDQSSFTSGFSSLFDGITAESGLSQNGSTLTTASSLSGVMVSVTDNDGSINDDPNYIIGASQTLAEDTTINGVTYSAGTNLEMGFVADVSSDDGVSRFYSIKIGDDIVGVAVYDPSAASATVFNPDVTAGISPGTTYSVFDTDNGNGGGTTTPYSDLLCFAAGTMILTDRGEVAVQDLRAGDLVMTRDEGLQELHWTGLRHVPAAMLAAAPHLRPIRIRAGALGAGRPARDLIVSPQHRILVSSRIAQRMFGAPEVLVAAKQLVLLDGIDILPASGGVDYVHILFDKHQIVFSNGAETESLFTGPEALKSVGPAARAEIFALFPELEHSEEIARAARPLCSGRMGRKLAHRHAQNRKPLLGTVQ